MPPPTASPAEKGSRPALPWGEEEEEEGKEGEEGEEPLC